MFIYIIEIAIVVFIVYVVLNIYYYKKINKKIELIQIDRETINKDKLIDYIYDKQPIIFTNMVEESDIKYWNFDYIKQYYPEYLLTIVSKYNSKRHMKVKIQNIPFDFNDNENETEYYIEDYEFLNKSGMSDVLKDDLSLLFPFLSVSNTFRLNMSKKDYSTKLYYKTDMYNYIVQLEGSQKIVLFHPKETKNLYKSDIYNKYRVQSNVDFWNLDNKKYPMMNKANYIEIILHPGNILLIPNYWWVTSKTLENSISIQVSVNTIPTHIIKIPEYMLQILHNIRLYKTYNCCCHFIPN